MTPTELLLYPIGRATDILSCDLCGAQMALARFERLPNRPEFSNFRCNDCCHSEMFLIDAEDKSPTLSPNN